MSALLPSKATFDSKRAVLEAATRAWAARECSSFDDSVLGPDADDEPSIWDMPRIDSKQAVLLLVELEPVLDVEEIDASVIKPGGYGDVEELVEHLLGRIRELCSDVPSLGTISEPATAEVTQ